MSTPTVIQKGGKRYVKVGKRRIKVHKSISERELIQWLIKQFKGKRRARKPKGETPSAFKVPIAVVTQGPTSDAARIAAREAKADLDKIKNEAKEELKQLKAELKQVQALPSAARPALPPGDAEKEEEEKKEDEEEIEIEGGIPIVSPKPGKVKQPEAAKKIEVTQAQIKQRLAAERDAATKLTQAKQRLVANSATRKQTLQFIEHDVMRGLKAKFPHPKLRTAAAGLGAGANPSHDDLINFFLKKSKSEVKRAEPGIRAKVEADYSNKLDDLDKDDAEADAMIAEIEAQIAAAQAGEGQRKDRGMSSTDIDHMMKEHPEYLGTIARDEIPLLKPGNKKRVCWIMNTDDRGLPGTHWVCFFIDVRKDGTHSVEYYDPLADPFSDLGVTSDLKRLIKQIHPADHYLKFRENTVRDQHPDSSNCGPFCIKFLKDRLKGDTFAKASGYDAKGEKNIEIWKRAQPQKLWISSQQGEGLRDIYEKVRDGATKIITRIKETINGRKGPSPSVRGWLSQHGDKEIKSIDVCKKPIYSMIEKIGNWLSAGKLRENMDKLGYESMMHLYMIVKLDDGSSWKVEKNHVLEIKASSDVGKQSMPAMAGGTVGKMIQVAEAKHGEMLWKYHLVNANCQKAVLWLLDSKVTTELRAFIEQDAAASLKGMGLLEKVATVITDTAARADVALNGAGMRINH